MDDPFSNTVVTDAIHHRLDNQFKPLGDFLYSCYDCPQKFSTLEDVAQHSLENPCHCEEMCLKCRSSITIFFESKKSVRIHSCKKSDICHGHPELYLHSHYLFLKFSSAGLISDHTFVGCDFLSCRASFEFTFDGIFQLLKHVNKHKHTTVPNCRKCTLPEFQLTVGNLKSTSHFCAKTGKVIFVSKSC